MPDVTVVYDSCVLYPAPLRDLLVHLALTGLLPPLILSKSALAFGLGFALLVGAAGGLLPGIGAMRMRVVNALRRV